MTKICAVKICERPAKANSYCNSHNERLRKTGSLNEDIAIRIKGKYGKICKIKNCNREHKAHGLCGAHYYRLRKWGSIKEDQPLRDYLSEICSIESCNLPKKARGFCDRHYESLRKHGDPLKRRTHTKRFSGKRLLSKEGYVWIYLPEHHLANKMGYVIEHRMIMEEMLGRPIRKNENVHHLNGNKQDNRPENLELWVKDQPCGQRREDLVNWAKEILRKYEKEIKEI